MAFSFLCSASVTSIEILLIGASTSPKIPRVQHLCNMNKCGRAGASIQKRKLVREQKHLRVLLPRSQVLRRWTRAIEFRPRIPFCSFGGDDGRPEKLIAVEGVTDIHDEVDRV